MNKFITLTLAAFLFTACASTNNNHSISNTNKNHLKELEIAFNKSFSNTDLLAYTQEDADKLLKENDDDARKLLAAVGAQNDTEIENIKAILPQMQGQRDINAKYSVYIINKPVENRKAAYAQKIELCTAKKMNCDMPVLLSLYKKYDFLEKAKPVLKDNLSSVDNTNEQSAECEKGTPQNCKQNYKAVSQKTTTVKYNSLATYLTPPVLEENSNIQKQTITVTCQSGYNAADNSCSKNYTKTIIDSTNNLSDVKTIIKCGSTKNGKCIGGGTVYNTGNFCRCGNYTYNLTVKKNADGTWAYESEYKAPHNGDANKSCAKIDTFSNVCIDGKETKSPFPQQYADNTIKNKLALEETYFEEFNFN